MIAPYPPVTPPAGAPGRLLQRLIDLFRQARERHATQRELRRFGPELLADLGIERDQIPAVAAGLVARTPEEQMATRPFAAAWTSPSAAARRGAEVHFLAQWRSPSARRPAVRPDCCAA